MYRKDLPQPIPNRILSLPIQNGFPVPWFVAKVDGNYDFRCIDSQKFAPAIKYRKCWICGQKLGGYLSRITEVLLGEYVNTTLKRQKWDLHPHLLVTTQPG